MAKFCKYCGKAIEENKICSCKESLIEARELMNQINSLEKEVVYVKKNNNSIIKLFKDYFLDFGNLKKELTEKNNSIFNIVLIISFMFGVVLNGIRNYTNIVNCINDDIEDIIYKIHNNYGVSTAYLNRYLIEMDNGIIIRSGISIAIISLILMYLSIIIISKIIDRKIDLKYILSISTINIIPINILLFLIVLLDFSGMHGLALIFQPIYFIIYITTIIVSINMITGGFNKGNQYIITIAIIIINVLILILVYFPSVCYIIGSFKINQRELGMYIQDIIHNIGGLTELIQNSIMLDF